MTNVPLETLVSSLSDASIPSSARRRRASARCAIAAALCHAERLDNRQDLEGGSDDMEPSFRIGHRVKVRFVESRSSPSGVPGAALTWCGRSFRNANHPVVVGRAISYLTTHVVRGAISRDLVVPSNVCVATGVSLRHQRSSAHYALLRSLSGGHEGTMDT